MSNRDLQAAKDIEKYLDFLMLDTIRTEKETRDFQNRPLQKKTGMLKK